MKKIFIKNLQDNTPCELLCWLSNKRITKNVAFLDLYDSSGNIQGVVDANENSYLIAKRINRESALKVFGQKVDEIFKISKIEIMALAKFNLNPSPNYKDFNILDKKYSNQFMKHQSLYIRNNTLKNIYYIKSVFKREIQNYFWNLDFVEFEAPTLTKQTLYDDSGAIWLGGRHKDISLSRCATFHLEPAVIPYEKIFTITNSHADEKIKTNRHLIEYLHLKAEICWINLDELIDFAGKMYYEIAKNTYEKCKKEFNSIILPEIIQEKLEKLKPENYIHITYDEAIKILHENSIDIEYGKSLTTKDEMFLTKYFGEKFIWVKFIPYTVEGFMFKRCQNNKFLTMTCDLIAPNGFGEILGCAEKMTDYDELLLSMKEKGKFKDYKRYEDYALLHKYGLPYHGGIGMGIERALRYLLNIDHVKYVKPFAVIKGTKVNH